MSDARPEGGPTVVDHAPPAATAAMVGWPPPPPPPPPAPHAAGVPVRRRSNRVRVAAAVAGALVAGAAIGIPIGLLTRGGSTTPSSTTSGGTKAQAQALYMQAIAATRAAAGFHYVAATTGATATQTIDGDATPSGGRQILTIDAPGGQEKFTLVLVSGTVYFEGNGAALQDQLGVPAASSTALVGKWISVAVGDGPYAIIAPGITITDQANETALVGTSTLPITTAAGVSATRIVGTVPPQQGAPGGSGYLDVASGSHLPISYRSTVSVSGVTVVSTTTFSGWGKAVVVATPSGAVAWSTLGATEPPRGYGGGASGVTPSPTPQL